MRLLDECIIALGKKTILLSKDKTHSVFESMEKNFPITTWGQIDWERVIHTIQLSSITDLTKHLNTDDDVYILWDEASLPAVQTKLSNVLRVIDDVTAVSFDTWLYNPINNYVIEFHHEGEIRIGFKAQ